MASLESLRHVSIGQYLPTGSLIHRLDARVKLMGILLMIIAVVIASGYTVNVVLDVLVLGLVALAKLPLRYILASVRPALPFIVILALMQLLFFGRGPAGDGQVILVWGPLVISWEGIRLVVVSLLRFVALLLLISLLTNTTTTGALTHGVEWWLRPLTAFGLPGHELALVMAIALRFLPILGEELEAIGQAQAARTVTSGSQSRWRIVANARRIANLIVPLFVSTLRRADEVTLAMLARCYHGGKGRTQLSPMRWRWGDTLALVAACIVLSAVIISQRLALP
ncbi:MAG: energy-coupling factor transporter transmembrane component T family protein [Anaerolineae bacterium]